MGIDSGYGIGSVKPGVCTSTTRPASPYVGQIIYETDTTLAKVWTGSAWVDTPPGKADSSSPTLQGMTTFSGGNLSSTQGSEMVPSRDYATTGNGDFLQSRLVRDSAGSDWTSASWYLQRKVDSSHLAFVRFSQNKISLGYGATEQLIADSSGRVRTPNHPVVHAVVGSGNTTWGSSGNNAIYFNSALVNVGSHFNTSNYTFTCPVAGRYLVMAQCQLSSNLSNGDWAFNLIITLNGYGQTGTYESPSTPRQYNKASVYGILNCSANDTIQIRVLTNQNTTLEGAGDTRNTLFITLLG